MTIETSAPMQRSATAAERKAASARRIARRYAAERRFRAYGIIAIGIGLFFLAMLFTSLISRGYTAFAQSTLSLDVVLDKATINPSGDVTNNEVRMADYMALAKKALYAALEINPASKPDVRQASALLSDNADVEIRDLVLANPSLIGQTVPMKLLASSNVDLVMKGQFDRTVPEANRKLSDKQLAWIDKLAAKGVLAKSFNWGLFTFGASSKPETAGIGVALVGTLFMMLTVLLVAVPIGIAAAIYLEEFAPKSIVTDIIEVNINNLAAVPSIVFGLLGLAMFINLGGLPRSASSSAALFSP